MLTDVEMNKLCRLQFWIRSRLDVAATDFFTDISGLKTTLSYI
jgi:hypothetical protein